MILDRFTRIGLIVSWNSLAVAVLAVFATWFSLKLNLVADYPLTIISTAVIFPIVFSIGHAYKRRESALDDYGVIKAHGRAVYFAARDWLPEQDADRIQHLERVLADLLHGCRDMFKGTRDEMPANERAVYAAFSELSEFVSGCAQRGLLQANVRAATNTSRK